jgi:DNA-binding response OmpR family regulator
MRRILYVEDEVSLATIVKESLETEGYQVDLADSENEAMKLYHTHSPNIIILDIMLRSGSGYSFARTLRKTDKSTPVIFLSAKSQVKDVIEGFETGGNDYVRKPFSTKELLARIKVLLNDDRQLTDDSKKTHLYTIGRFAFDALNQKLKCAEHVKFLTARESMLLELLCRHRDQLVPKQTILLEIWEDDSFFNSRSMDVFISRLRKHLKWDPEVRIINIRGMGYKLICPGE